MKNKVLCCLLLLATIFNFIPSVNAQSMEDTLYIDYSNEWWVATKGYTGTHYVKTKEQMIRRRSDNKAVYCIQPQVRFIDDSHVSGIIDQNQMIDISSLSRETIDRINLLTYYGYGYTGHTSSEWYYATQMMIWDTTQPGWVYPIADNDASLTRSDRYDTYYNEINDLINKHTNRPSFHGQTLTLRVGETTTIHDNNNLLGKFYTGVENEHYKADVVGNDLIVTPKTAYNGEITLNAKENPNPPMLYIGAQQLVISISDPDYHFTKIKLDSLIEGKFIKYYGSSEDGVYRTEKNAEFEIYNSDTNTLLATVKTNDDGLFTYEFGIGNYRIHQVKGEKGYKFIKDINFTVDSNSKKEEFVLKNESTSNPLEFTKTDISTGKPLPNTTIEIYNEKDQLIFTGTTDSNGKIVIKDLEYGKYYILEKNAPNGYKVNPNKIYFEIFEDGKIVKATMQDELIEVPNTGISDSKILNIIGIILMITGVGYIIYDKKKNK